MTVHSWSVVFLSSGKAEVFLEVFGNSEVRSETWEVVRQAAAQLCHYVTDCLETDPHPCLDTTPLKVGHQKSISVLVAYTNQCVLDKPVTAHLHK